jgi:cyclopropane fatty-acyl-phospholipid synthase-like methyltransferase
MKISLDRNEFIANKLGFLNKETLLDIGCRDMILKKYLIGKFKYIGIDYQIHLKKSKDFVNCNLENGIPKISNVDIITAIDVLEHLENIHNVFSSLFLLSKKKIIIALPNMGYYKFRIKFFFTGCLSGKYNFSERKIFDRHRWIPNYQSIDRFVKTNTPKNWKIIEYNYIAERKRNYLFYFIEKILSKMFPSLFVYEKIYFFIKKTRVKF